MTRAQAWNIDGSHFAERFQLFIIIALGEGIVVTGATASSHELTTVTLAALVVAFIGSAALWWLYFDYVAAISAVRLRVGEDRGQLARDAFTYLHIPIVAGIILVAVGDEILLVHPTDPLHSWDVAMLVAGPILYLLGHNLFRWRMAGTMSTRRFVAMAAILAIGLAGGTLHLSAFVIATLVVVVLVALIVLETRWTLRWKASGRYDAFIARLEAGEELAPGGPATVE